MPQVGEDIVITHLTVCSSGPVTQKLFDLKILHKVGLYNISVILKGNLDLGMF